MSFKDTKLQRIPSRFELVAEYVRVFEPLIMTNVVLNFTVFEKSQQKNNVKGYSYYGARKAVFATLNFKHFCCIKFHMQL